MTTLLRTPGIVHPSWLVEAPPRPPEFEGDVEPPPAEPEPYHPSILDETYDLGYRLARAGEIPRYHHLRETPGKIIPTEVHFAYVRGVGQGHIDRGIAEARELGRSLAGIDGGPSEPPPGLTPREKIAFREGFTERANEIIDEVAYHAHLDSIHAEMAEAMFGGYKVTDRDMYPMGCVS